MSVIRSVIPRNVVHFQKGLSEADVVTGRLVERTLCFRLIRPLFLQFYRHYNSGHNGLSRGLGFGHAHSYDHRLSFDADGLLLEEPIGLRTGFPVLRSDGDAHTARGRTLQRVSLLHYTLARPAEPLIRFEFADPEHAARIARFTFGARAIGFKYGKDGRLTFITHPTGLRIAVEEDNAGRLLSLSGPWDGGSDDRLILSCEYDDAGNCVGMIDARTESWPFASVTCGSARSPKFRNLTADSGNIIATRRA